MLLKTQRTFLRPARHSVGNMASTHKVTQHKKGKDSLYTQGKRHYDRKQSGHTKPIFQNKAKTTKIVLRLECVESTCRSERMLASERCILNWEAIRRERVK